MSDPIPIEIRWVIAAGLLPDTWRAHVMHHGGFSGFGVDVNETDALVYWDETEVDFYPLDEGLYLRLDHDQTALGLSLKLDEWESHIRGLVPMWTSRLASRCRSWLEGSVEDRKKVLIPMRDEVVKIGMDHYVRRRRGHEPKPGTRAKLWRDQHRLIWVFTCDGVDHAFSHLDVGWGLKDRATQIPSLEGVDDEHIALRVIANHLTPGGE